MSYCRKCGAEKIPEWTGYFNSETGEKEYREICPTDPCGHGYHNNKFIASFYNPFAPDFRCKRCGKTSNYPY